MSYPIGLTLRACACLVGISAILYAPTPGGASAVTVPLLVSVRAECDVQTTDVGQSAGILDGQGNSEVSGTAPPPVQTDGGSVRTGVWVDMLAVCTPAQGSPKVAL
jgi:hypothetical protein